jgi:ribose/xylose/arabinose/galactoside ABC-type transport system permease subunit
VTAPNATVGPLRRPTVRVDLLARYALAVIMLVALAAASWSSFSLHRVLYILGQASPLGVSAIGQTFVLLSGGIDLSVGPVINLTNVIAPVAMNGQNGNIVPALVISGAAAALIGVVNGLLVAFLRVPALLATLAVGTIVQGAYFIYTRGQPSGNASPDFLKLASAWLGGNAAPWDFVLWIAVWAAAALLLYRTIYGRKFYAVGANPRAAWLSGVRASWYVVSAYVISALCAWIAGLILTSYIGLASIGVGDPDTLNSIAAAVIGGTAFTGGIGTLGGTAAGVLVISFLTTILGVLNVPAASQYIAQGVVIAGMMFLNNRLIGRR